MGLGHRKPVPFSLEKVYSARGDSWHPLYERRLGQMMPVPAAPVANGGVPRSEEIGRSLCSTPATHDIPEGIQSSRTTPLIEQKTTGLWRVRAITPLRMTHQGKLVQRFAFPLFLRALLFRLDNLARLYGAGPLPVDIPRLLRLAEAVIPTESTMRWTEFVRFSERQGGRRKMGGLMGQTILSGDIGLFLPWLSLGEELHVGKASSFGLGKFRVEIK